MDKLWQNPRKVDLTNNEIEYYAIGVKLIAIIKNNPVSMGMFKPNKIVILNTSCHSELMYPQIFYK